MPDKKMIFALGALLFAVFLIGGCVDAGPGGNVKNQQQPPAPKDEPQAPPQAPNDGNASGLLIANWNLQIFGKAKAANAPLMDYYAGKIRDYNIIIVQEIRDIGGTAFPKLCEMLPEYNCVVSSPAGRSNSKEQYGIIYKDAQLLSEHDYNPDSNADFERPPFAAAFRYGGWEFTILTIHTKPEDVKNELAALQELADKIGGEVIIMGDLNADCSYYNEEKNEELDSWNWAIPNSEDTTVTKTDCAYDRMIFNDPVKDNFVKYGVMRDVNSSQSDHYLIWGEYRAG